MGTNVFNRSESKLIQGLLFNRQNDEKTSNPHAGPCWPSCRFSGRLSHQWWTSNVGKACHPSGEDKMDKHFAGVPVPSADPTVTCVMEYHVSQPRINEDEE